jgi:outer membrane protein assembly factor BamB
MSERSASFMALLAIGMVAGCPRQPGSPGAGSDASQTAGTCDQNRGGCDPNAACVQRASSRVCICYPWYVGDGLTCTKSGLQPGSPWPVLGGNAWHTGQSAYVGPQTNHMKWSPAVKMEGSGGIPAPVIDANGIVYVGASQNFHAYDPDGNPRWTFPAKNVFDWSTPALSPDGTLFVLAEKILYALDTGADPTGRVKWRSNINDEFGSSPVIGLDGTVYVPSGIRQGCTGATYAFDPTSDSPEAAYRWSLPTGCSTGISPALGSDGTLFLTDADAVEGGHLYAIDPQGHLRWPPVSIAGGAVSASPAIGPDGTVYVGSETGYLYALNPTTGASKSRPVVDYVYSLAVGADGTVYVGAKGKKLVALDPGSFWRSGETKWTLPTLDAVRAIVLGADGTIYYSANQLYAINSDGSPKWSTDSMLLPIGPPAISADGTLYVLDGYGSLYAFGQ